MTPTAPDLLPCPFCGEMPTFTESGRVTCRNKNCDVYVITNDGDLFREAQWNTRAAPRWIPVTERLPEENDAVLVVWKDGDIGLAFMHKDDWDYATHWMPLPLPPKEVEG